MTHSRPWPSAASALLALSLASCRVPTTAPAAQVGNEQARKGSPLPRSRSMMLTRARGWSRRIFLRVSSRSIAARHNLMFTVFVRVNIT